MTEVWSSDAHQTKKGVAVYVNGQLVKVFKSLTKKDIINLANKHRLARFTVSRDGMLLDANSRAFPIKSGRIDLTEYNEAK